MKRGYAAAFSRKAAHGPALSFASEKNEIPPVWLDSSIDSAVDSRIAFVRARAAAGKRAAQTAWNVSRQRDCRSKRSCGSGTVRGVHRRVAQHRSRRDRYADDSRQGYDQGLSRHSHRSHRQFRLCGRTGPGNRGGKQSRWSFRGGLADRRVSGASQRGRDPSGGDHPVGNQWRKPRFLHHGRRGSRRFTGGYVACAHRRRVDKHFYHGRGHRGTGASGFRFVLRGGRRAQET